MKRLATFLLLGWLGTVPAFGAPSTNYEVEVLVFETLLPELEGSELWTRLELPADAAASAKAEDLGTASGFAAAAAALQADGRYRVLLQKRWVQNADAKSNVPAVSLTTVNRELDGILRFYLSRFLHLELNASFQPQAATIGSDAAPSYVISEQRRIKSNEVHYFDHPKFGVLVKVSPAPA